MRILSMHATFGKLKGQTLTLKPGLNILEAPNEWGKSTWCAFLMAMFYGIETRVHSTKTGLADKERYAPWSGQPMSGRMDILWNDREITVERSTKRVPLGIFRAYETRTGLPVPELTADNCGLLLLGVEKEVFRRAGFLHLQDLPVTPNEALRQRLNALVTTGDESGEADLLANRLSKLKNALQSNSKTGQLPRAEAELKALEDTLGNLRQLQQECCRLTARQQELQAHLEKLRQHKDVLRSRASLEAQRQLAQAQAAEQAARGELEALKAKCAALPPREEAQKFLGELESLLEQQQALYLEVQMQPQLSNPPRPPFAMPEATPEDVDEKLADDLQLHATVTEKLKKPPFPLWIPGLVLLGGSAVLAFFLLWAGLALGAVGLALTAAGLVARRRYHSTREEIRALLALLESEYGSADPSQWHLTTDRFRKEYEEYEEKRKIHLQELDSLRRRHTELEAKLTELVGDRSRESAVAALKEVLRLWDALGDARREHRRSENLVRSMEAAIPPAPAEYDDGLQLSEADTDALISDTETRLRQVQQALGRCMGQMDMCGSETELTERQNSLRERVHRLKQMLAAVALAQNTLTEATAQLQRRFAPRLSQRAGDYFARLTQGRYLDLKLDRELSLSIRAEEEATLRSPLWHSDGTADQLYLALRLAVAAELTPQAPLILDDALVRFDDTRLNAALQLLQEESKDKQILLFTCQSRERTLLAQ